MDQYRLTNNTNVHNNGITSDESPYLLVSMEMDGRERVCSTNLAVAGAIKHLSRGSYTVMATYNTNSVLLLDMHCERLAHTCRAIHADCSAEDCRVEIFTDAKRVRSFICGALPRVLGLFTGTPLSDDGSASPCQYRVAIHIAVPDGAVTFHVGPMQIVSQVTPSVSVDMRAGVRAYSDAKDSQWVHDRAIYTKTAGSDEVVLYAPDTGIISEGLSSNFFLLSGNKLYTTMTGVIVGTVRAMVLDAAQEMGLAIEPVLTVADVTGLAPCGCFITSTSRHLLPIDKIYLHTETGLQTVPMDVDMTRKLQEATVRQMERHCTPLTNEGGVSCDVMGNQVRLVFAEG